MSTNEYQIIKYLSQDIRDLKARLKKLNERIERLNTQVESTTVAITGLPRSTAVSQLREALFDLRAKYEQQIEVLEFKVLELQRQIESFEDPTVRLAMRYRFVDGLSWSQVASRLGGLNTSDSIRMRVKRAIKS